MTELNKFLTGLHQKECQSSDECIENLISGEYTHTYYTHVYRIPTSEKNKEVCMCIEPTHHMMKPSQCRGDCKNNRPFYVIDLHIPEKADMIDAFTSNVDFTVYIGGRTLVNEKGRILNLCSVFHGKYALIYLDQLNMPNEIIFVKRSHYFSSDIRRAIINTMNPHGILDGDLLYKYGMVGFYNISSKTQPDHSDANIQRNHQAEDVSQ